MKNVAKLNEKERKELFSETATALAQPDLLAEVVAFKEKFYPSAWANYGTATLAGLVLHPSAHHLAALKADYEQMQEMLFGNKPSFAHILATLTELEHEVRALH